MHWDVTHLHQTVRGDTVPHADAEHFQTCASSPSSTEAPRDASLPREINTETHVVVDAVHRAKQCREMSDGRKRCAVCLRSRLSRAPAAEIMTMLLLHVARVSGLRCIYYYYYYYFQLSARSLDTIHAFRAKCICTCLKWLGTCCKWNRFSLLRFER